MKLNETECNGAGELPFTEGEWYGIDDDTIERRSKNKMEQQTINEPTPEQETNEVKSTENKTDWLDKEIAGIGQHTDFEELPSLKLEENKVVKVQIDFSNPFDRWDGEQNGKPITKKIIPVIHEGIKKNWWLNVKNPVYGDVCKKGKEGITEFKVIQTGKQASTKYALVED